MQQIADGVYRLGSHWVNFYLVVENGGVTVVDAGFPGYVPMFRDALRNLNLGTADIKAVVLTHTHVDHIGAAPEISEEAGCPVLVHEGEVGIATGTEKPGSPKGFWSNAWRPNALKFIAHAGANKGTKQGVVADATGYADGEVLDVPGRPRVLFTPGHSRAHSALLLEGKRVLFCGDAMATLSVTTGETGPMLHPLNEDTGRARESLTRLESVDANVTLPGHGEPWRGSPADAVAQARSGR